MGRRGPKSKSAALAELHGNVGHKAREALQDGEIVQGVGALWAPPAWLDAEQRNQWRRAIDHAPPGLLTGSDRDLLGIWVVAAIEYATAVRKVREEGSIIETKNGNPIQNPYLAIMNRQAVIMLRAAKDLGFTPAARVALGGAMPERTGQRARRRKGSLQAYLEQKPDDLPN